MRPSPVAGGSSPSRSARRARVCGIARGSTCASLALAAAFLAASTNASAEPQVQEPSSEPVAVPVPVPEPSDARPEPAAAEDTSATDESVVAKEAIVEESATGAGGPSTAAAGRDNVKGGDEPSERVVTDPGAAKVPRYNGLRYLEDYRYLARQPSTDLWDPVKFIPLWEGGYLSVGGQHRIRYESVDPDGLGIGSDAPSESVLFSRNLVHLDAQLTPELRVFAQLGAWIAWGEHDRATPPDADDGDVAQLFVEGRATVGDVRIVTRVGRQEMPLGSSRWVSVRDGANMRQAFDLVRTTVGSAHSDVWKVDVFGGVVPLLQRGAFDDRPNWENKFWGAYGTFQALPKKLLSFDAYYLGRQRPDVSYDEVSGRETRHTFGVRIFGQTDFGLEYIEHAMVQVGTLGDANILAWGFASALWQHVHGVLDGLHIGVRSDALSGDSSPGSRTVSTFHPLFPNQTFFSALPAIYPTNMYDLHPLAKLSFGKADLEAGCVFFWRQSVDDAVYQPPGSPLLTANESRARFTGTQPSVSLGYQADRHLSFNLEWSHIFPGPAINDAGGRNVDFIGTWTTYTY